MSTPRAGASAALRAAVAVALGACLVAGVLSAARRDWGRHQRLRAAGMPADGWVTAKNYKDNRRVAYSYRVGERTFSGVGVAGYGNPEFGELSPGDRVLVVYLATDPSYSVMGDPYEHLRSQNQALLFLLIMAGAAVFALVRLEQRRFR